MRLIALKKGMLLACALASSGGPCSSQALFEPREFTPSANGTVAYDSAHGQVVFFGGFLPESRSYPCNHTWTRGRTWTFRAPATSPGRRRSHAMTFDPIRQRVVMVGGHATPFQTSSLRECWEWDGNTWASKGYAGNPDLGFDPACAWDPVRKRTLFMGGQDIGGWKSNDIYEWDGTRFQQVPTTTRPTADLQWLSTDEVRQRVVLFNSRNETWEWDGSTWTRRLTSPQPTYYGGAAFTYDTLRRRSVLVTNGTTWEWDGTSWQRITSAVLPANLDHSFAYYDPHRRRVVLLSQAARTLDLAPELEFDGAVWSSSQKIGGPSGSRTQQNLAMTTDTVRNRIVAFGGANLDELWEWNGSSWLRQARSGTWPPGRTASRLAFQASTGKTLMFGGANGSTLLSDTAEWDGRIWQRHSPTASPTARQGFGLAFDSARSRAVLFGGEGSTLLGDTWEWDGATWTQRFPATSPSPRTNMAMAYDQVRQRVVLLGGSLGTTTLGDTWEWDGTNWLLRTSIAPRAFAACAFDPTRGRVVVYGGNVGGLGSPTVNEIREWNGAQWLSAVPAPQPEVADLCTMTHDPFRSAMLVRDSAGYSWEFRTRYLPEFVPFGRGCLGSAGVPVLTAKSLPWLGENHSLTIEHAPSGANGLWLLGTSSTQWAGAALPLDLGVFGMTGCELRTSVDLALPFVGSNIVVAIPGASETLGLPFYEQALVFDTLANPAGITATNAALAIPGAR